MIDFLKQHQIEYRQDVPLSALTTFRIGGPAELVILPDSEDKISLLYKAFSSFFVMGNGSNLLFADHPFKTPIIKTDKLTEMRRDGDLFTFGAGVKLAAAALFAAEQGYTGLEFAQGIPGSIGGAVYMNAGAYDGEMSGVVYATRFIDETGEVRTVYDEEHDFSYRRSCFCNTNKLITSCTVRLAPGDRDEIQSKMADFAERRRSKQPLSFPSAGSTFKRPVGAYAAKLIEDCGLKGYQIGGAQVSEKHSGFVINRGGATFLDVMRVIGHVQKTVREQTGYELECEVRIIE